MAIALLSFAWDASSSYARGPAHGPAVIRSILKSEASTPYSLSGLDHRAAISREVAPTLGPTAADCRRQIEEIVASALEGGLKPLSLGGDHSITYPILKAVAATHGPVNILHVDAHTDLYDQLNGDRYSHGAPFRRAIEDGCVGTLVQIGLRSIGPDERAFGESHDVVMLGADALDQIPYDRLAAPLYVTIDLDGLDPAFAPGVSHPEPGGLSTREVLGVLTRLPAAPIGADICELNPERDVNLLTAHVAARFVKELAALMA